MSKRARRCPMSRWRQARAFRRRIDQIDRAAAGTRRCVEAAAEVTQQSLQLVAACSEIEARLAGAHPLDAERYQVVVDALAALAAREIAELGRGEEP
jgi:hypothetical protein